MRATAAYSPTRAFEQASLHAIAVLCLIFLLAGILNTSTVSVPSIGGSVAGTPTSIKTIYDPQAEHVAAGSGSGRFAGGEPIGQDERGRARQFLEIGVNIDGAQHWKVFGPDLNGSSLNGTGGLEAVITPTGTEGAINDAFGNVVAAVESGNIIWNPAKVGSYGTLPNAPPQFLEQGASLIAASAWRTRRSDPTGYTWMGARHYDQVSGRFLSADPLGHAASWNLYDFANGDPVNQFDADGRFGKGVASGATFHSKMGDPFSPSANAGFKTGMAVSGTAQVVGNSIGDLLSGVAAMANPNTYIHGYQNLDSRVTSIVDSNVAMGMNPAQAALSVPGITVLEMLGVNSMVEGASGYDLATGQDLDGWQRSQRLAGATAQFAGTLAGVSGSLKVGARAGTPFESMVQRVNTLDFSTPANKAIFYSGPGQGARATAFAERTGGMTIEMTAGGRALAADPVFQSLAPAQQFQIWQRASSPFAEGASGGINAFIRGARPDRTFRTIEEPLLNANPNVYRSTYHY